MSLYNEDELAAPSWINEEFLKNVLIKCENNKELEIINYDLSPASMKGDHYASIMFRCKVNYQLVEKGSPLQKRFIIKTIPVDDGMKREMLMETKLFENEIEMYTETLPKIEKILAECGEPTKLSAEIYYHGVAPHKFLVLEDLCESGYDTVRNRFLTEDEIKGIYSKLAKLHAVSYMLGHSEDHKSVTKHQENFFSIDVPLMNDLVTNGIANFIKLLASHKEFEVYLEKVKDMEEELVQSCKDMYNAYILKKGQGDIFVLNHGDFHMKNLMFKFSKENHLEDMIMVDYQISCYAPSVIDLTYSQYLMISCDLRLRRHELTQFYFSEFTRILKKINYQGQLPKYSQFQIDALKYRHYSIFLLAIMLPMVAGILGKTVEELKDTNIAELMENSGINFDNYNDPIYVNDIRRFLPILLREGYLD